ncbi:hypothetical protein [Deinococcus humi]|uniref:Uncharacterized protein n=1 Tax=Deinococcus humi TaxID=662880 RepID=A0A7W8K008_9DEIO|nr:hypothetical protein [Deinococcus humi]MBB5366351.1 hypothetical protein [Deinococcus humi]GGO41407.1 hypothetical protein GCM10008949_52180 [Deinococcus humi]
MLPADLEAMWQRYREEEQRGVRTEALRLLDRFLHAFPTQALSFQRAWVRQTMASIVDEGDNVPVRFPLFRRVLLPILVEGVNTHQPGCARWLAAFGSMLVSSRPTGLSPELESHAGLLREAVRLDPSDQRSLEQLLACDAEYFAYTLHELPTGVLSGLHGATREQCDVLLDRLEEFETHLHRSEQAAKYQELVNEGRFHYRAYRQYLMTRPEGMSYARYLQSYSPDTEVES